MFKIFMVMSVLLCGKAFAQDMARTEDYRDVYVDMPDGSSRYVGKCSTHEDYENIYFKKTKELQSHVEPRELTQSQLKAMLGKFDKEAITALLNAFDLYEVGQGEDEVSIFSNYVDDFFAETIVHARNPKVKLLRFGMGVGGGNGGYVVLRQLTQGSKRSYKLLSFTFDSDLNFCDKEVWLN